MKVADKFYELRKFTNTECANNENQLPHMCIEMHAYTQDHHICRHIHMWIELAHTLITL